MDTEQYRERAECIHTNIFPAVFISELKITFIDQKYFTFECVRFCGGFQGL